MIAALRSVHEHGVLHRDVKPSNFSVGLPPDDTHVFLLDFGLSRIYRTADGQVRAPREVAGFRGTCRYASINTHQAMEMGRRDDMWSFYYMVVEFLRGSLPWRRLRDKHEVCVMKAQCDHAALVDQLPTGFRAIHDAISCLKYADRPNYELILDELQRMLDESHVHNGVPLRFPWQPPRSRHTNTTAQSQSPIKLLTLSPRINVDNVPVTEVRGADGVDEKAHEQNMSNSESDRAEEESMHPPDTTPEAQKEHTVRFSLLGIFLLFDRIFCCSKQRKHNRPLTGHLSPSRVPSPW